MTRKFRTSFQIFANEFTLKQSKGKDYLVVPGVIVREQVMNHYYVPADELAFAEAWNGTPVTLRHPQQNNGSANVPDPDVAVIGRFFNAEWDDDNKRITGEYWIDISEAMQYVEGQYVVNSIYANQVLETSTGYWASEEFTEGEFDGRSYVTIQHNLKPDHVAILVDEIGACSVADGCGVNRNSLLYSLYTNAVELNGGPGSGYWGHLGRPGQVGGAAPTGKSVGKKKPASKRLKKGLKAYYVANKAEAEKKNKSGFKTKVSLMSKSKAAALFNKMTKGGSEAAILEVNLKKGTPYESLSANSITVVDVPSGDIKIISFETLQSRTTEAFTNAADCECVDAKRVVENEESITQMVEAIRKSFYEQIHSENMVYSTYIRDYFSDYIIVEMGDKLWKATYSKNGESYSFQKPDEWTQVQFKQEYVEANKQVQNVLGDLPARAKKLWEKVYNDWLAEHPKDKAGASKRAWGAVKQAGWKKNDEGEWVKSNTIVKGVPTTKVITKRTGEQKAWTVTNSKKEKHMKLSMKAILDALRGKGVTINADEVDEEEILEMEDQIDEDGEEEEDTEEVTQMTARAPKPQFTNKQVATLKKLAETDFSGLLKAVEQLPVVLEVAKNAEAERATRKTQLIAGIKANSSQPFTDEELAAMELPILTKIHGQYNVDYSGIAPTGYEFSMNTAGDDDEVLGVPSIVLNAEEEA